MSEKDQEKNAAEDNSANDWMIKSVINLAMHDRMIKVVTELVMLSNALRIEKNDATAELESWKKRALTYEALYVRGLSEKTRVGGPLEEYEKIEGCDE